MKYPNEVAFLNKSAVSDSGDLHLYILEANEGEIPYQKFQIKTSSGQVVFDSEDKFDVRHTTYFLWGEGDRVWVYSGDLGTFFWEMDHGNQEWKKKVYATNKVPAPRFLKKQRPKWHKI